MSFCQVSDLLKAARQFHRDLREYFEASREEPQRERVRLLLDYMAARERDLEAELARFAAHAPRGALDTYFQFADENELQAAPRRLAPGMTIDQVVEAALAFDRVLIDFFSRLAEMADTEGVAEIFRSLAQRQRAERARLLQSAQAAKDL